MVHIVVGEVSVTRGVETHDAVIEFRLKPHDDVATARNSKVKIVAGTGSVYANEGALFKIAPTMEEESCAVVVNSGEYYFLAQDSGSLSCRFGDMSIYMQNAAAALTISSSGRLAEFFVISGSASIRRGSEERQVASCQAVALDAAGISDDDVINQYRGNAILRLKSWIGEATIERATFSESCDPKPAGGAVGKSEQLEALNADSVVKANKKATVQSRPPIISAGIIAAARRILASMSPTIDTSDTTSETPKSASVDTVIEAAPFSHLSDFMIEHIVGPKQVYAGDEFVLKCKTTGSDTATGYVWWFSNDSVSMELVTKEPQVTVKIETAGALAITCEAIGEDSAIIASRLVMINVLANQIAINAGGPYSAWLNKPVKLLGNARCRLGKIIRYEWYFSLGGDKPDFVSDENAIVEYTYAKTGQYRAVYKVTLDDGTSASDTAVINVTNIPPTVNAGADIVPTPNGNVKLEGTGSSIYGDIVKYEWNFNGDDVYDWSSETSGTVEHIFKEFAYPVLRVTDAKGNTATDTMRVVICPKDMITVANGKFCVDKYEWPNKRGAIPLANVNWYEAAQMCENAGKRLCTANEWRRACWNDDNLRPADGQIYPYGEEFDGSKCNTLDNPKTKNVLFAAGMLRDCAGKLSIYDMSGNAAEWVAAAHSDKAQAFGGFYQLGANGSDCDSYLTLDKDKRYFYVGFRCCK